MHEQHCWTSKYCSSLFKKCCSAIMKQQGYIHGCWKRGNVVIKRAILILLTCLFHARFNLFQFNNVLTTLFMLTSTTFMLTSTTLFMFTSTTLFMLTSTTLFILTSTTLFMLTNTTLFILTSTILFILASTTLQSGNKS